MLRSFVREVGFHWVVMLLVLTVAGGALAGGSGPKKVKNPEYPAAKKLVESVEKEVLTARGKMKAASDAYSKALAARQQAREDSSNIVQDLRNEAEKQPQWVEAQKHYDEINNQIDQLREKAIEALKDDADYQQAVAAKEEADSKLAEYKQRLPGTIKATDMMDAANSAIAAGTRIQQIINAQVAKDPKSEELNTALKEVQQQLIKLRSEQEAATRRDDNFRKAAKAADAAEDKLAAAKADLQLASRDYNTTLKKYQVARDNLAATPEEIYSTGNKNNTTKKK